MARAQVGGKIARVGSRLVDAAAAKVAQDFFQAFESKLGAQAAAAKGVPVWWSAVGVAIVLLAIYLLRR